MKRLASILLFLLPMAVLGQATPETKPWDLGCGNLDTQQQMNACSYKAFMLADSVLAHTYDQLAAYLTANYEKEAQAIKQTGTAPERAYLASLQNQTTSLLASHEGFIIYRDHMVRLIAENYAGGSIRPFVENAYALELTVNHLNVLNRMMEEIMPQK